METLAGKAALVRNLALSPSASQARPALAVIEGPRKL